MKKRKTGFMGDKRMSRNEVLERLMKVFRDVFDDYNLTISESTSAKDIKKWDSLMHITLISEISDEFDVEFEMEDVTGMKDVGEMVEKILRLVK